MNRDWIDEILGLGDNRTLLPRLLGQFRESGVVPFVGAGLSAPYNLPQWAELLKALAPDEDFTKQIDGLLSEGDYEVAAELLMAVRGPRRFQLLFREIFEAAPIDISKTSAVRLLARLRRGPIVTTNFDSVVESVLRHEGCAPEVITGDRPEAISRVFQYDRDALIKLHGDFADPAGRVFTKSEYDEAYSKWLDTLLRNVATRCMLFLGCSLKTDRPMKVLADLVKAGHGLIHHYALLSFPTTPDELRERTRRLSEECHIDAIWYPSGRHEYVERLLGYVIEEVRPDPPRNRKGPIYRNIPAGRATLIGRNSDALVTLIENSRLVSVEGDRGVGKTSFALQAVRKFMERDTFGALAWITASARKESLRLSHVLDAISLAIDYPFRTLATTAEKEAKLVEQLARRRSKCLLLFDNYETVADPDVEEFLFDLKRLPENLHVLFTMSGRLERAGVVPYPLGELEASDMMALFRERLALHRLKWESDEDIMALHALIGGNPLAVELIVGLLRSGRDLRGLSAGLAEGTGAVLQRIFEEAWRLLDAGQRNVLETVSIFVRPALADAVQAGANVTRIGFGEALEVLARLYLLKRLTMHEEQESILSGRRYFMHPYIRDLVEARRDDRTEGELYNRLATFYTHFIPERGGTPEKEEATEVQELNGELENILGVLDGCSKVHAEKQVVAVVAGMARWLFTESHWDDLEKYGTWAAGAAQRLGDPHSAARILGEIGRTHAYRQDFPRAQKVLDESLKLARRKPPDSWAVAYIQHHIGELLMRQKRYPEAAALLQKSLKGFTKIDSVRSMIGVTYRLAMLAFESGDLPEAKRLAEKGVEDTLRERWERLEGFNRRLLGDIAIRLRQLPEARFQYERALQVVPQRDMRIQALIEFSLARLESESGDAAQAREKAALALLHFEKLRMPKEAEEARRMAAGLPSAEERPRESH